MMSNHKLAFVRAAVLVVILGLVGCGRPYAGASERTYQIATALVSVCERKADDKLVEVEDLIAKGESDGSVPSDEAAYLRAIIATAKEGGWDDAKRTARQVLADQVEAI